MPYSSFAINTSITHPCPNHASISNGFCNSENNNLICNYDGGDCCPNSDLIGNDQCDNFNYNHVCHFDGGDCCYKQFSGQNIGDSRCTYFYNLEMCNFDKGDCCDHSRIGDGICDETNNNRLCSFDGGDCCFGNKNTSRCSSCKCFEVFDVISIFGFKIYVYSLTGFSFPYKGIAK